MNRSTAATICVLLVGCGLGLAYLLRPSSEALLPGYWTSVINTVVVATTFVAIWWYTEETAGFRRDTVTAQKAALEAHVVIKRRRTVSQTGSGESHGWDYVASNVGPGVAKRVVYFTDGEPFEPVAALQPGEVIRLRDVIVDGLRSQMRDTSRTQTHYLLAEGLDGRWYKSANAVNGSGDIAMASTEYKPTRAEIEKINKLVESMEDFRRAAIAPMQAQAGHGQAS